MEGLPKRHLLVPVDESKASQRVLQWTLDNLYREGDEIHLFHVVPPGQYVVLSTDLGMEEVVEDDKETQERVEANARKFLNETFVPVLQEKNIPYQLEIVKFSTDNDSIGSIVCKRADQINASAIVMAKHTKGAIKEFFLGSVSNYCTHHSIAPVLVLHCD